MLSTVTRLRFIQALHPWQARRGLGSWAARFEEARAEDATLATRVALGDDLQDVFKVEMDADEAKAMEAEAGAAAGSQLTIVLSVESTAVAIIRGALMPSGQSGDTTGLLIGAQADPAVPLALVGSKLVSAARDELRGRGATRSMAVAPLPGFCEWILREKAWDSPAFSPDENASVEAIAKGQPRPGHSVLGQGTFKAAQPAIEKLALAYATTELRVNQDSEVCMFAEAGAEVERVNYMHAQDPEALRECAGCTVSMRFPLA